MEILAAFIIGSAILFAEGRNRHAWGYVIVAALMFVFLLAGAR